MDLQDEIDRLTAEVARSNRYIERLKAENAELLDEIAALSPPQPPE